MNQGSGSGSGLWEEAWIKIRITDLKPGGRNAPVKTLHGKNAKHHATARILPIPILLGAASLFFLLFFHPLILMDLFVYGTSIILTKNRWKLKIQKIFAGLGIWPHMLGKLPHSCTQFMNMFILILGRLGWAVCLSWPQCCGSGSVLDLYWIQT